MTDIEKALERVGLSQNEIKVYLTLNDHGSMKAGRIAKFAKMDIIVWLRIILMQNAGPQVLK